MVQGAGFDPISSAYSFPNPSSKHGNAGPSALPRSGGSYASYESFAYDSLSVQYTSKDGDTLEIRYDQMTYAAMEIAQGGKGGGIGGPGKGMAIDGPGNGRLQQILNEIQSSVHSIKQQILKSFMEAQGLEFREVEGDYDAKAVNELEAMMPEYWNAENTSQRIVDFATAFFGVHGEGSLEEFVSAIKEAVDLGFGQAEEITGELTGAVGGLIQKTQDLVMQKIDEWANGISAPAEEVAA